MPVNTSENPEVTVYESMTIANPISIVTIDFSGSLLIPRIAVIPV